jgi:hypothetical protein
MINLNPDASSAGLIQTYSSTPLVFGTNDTERVRLTPGGNVLIGTTSDDGTSALQVDGNVTTTGTGTFGESVTTDSTYSFPYAEGSEIVTNGDFSSGSTGWTGGAGWSVPAYRITYSSELTPTPVSGAVYTHNGNSYTFISRTTPELVFTGSVAPLSSGTLTKSSGTGPATIDFTSFAYCAAKASGSAGTLTQDVPIEAGSTYVLRFDGLQSNYVAGGMDVTIGGNTMSIPNQVYTYSYFYEFYAYNDDPLVFSPASETQFGIVNISLKKITGSGRFGKIYTDTITPYEGDSDVEAFSGSITYDAVNNRWETKSLSLQSLSIDSLSTNYIYSKDSLSSLYYDTTLSGPEGDGGWSLSGLLGANNFFAPYIFTYTLFAPGISIDKDYTAYFFWDSVDSWDFGTGNIKTIGTGTFGGLTILDGTDIALDTTTGTKIGTATTQKLGFFNATPVVQQTATTDLGTALSNLGLRAAGTAYPITTSGTVAFGGNVGIGTTAPTSKLSVDGSIYLKGLPTTGTASAKTLCIGLDNVIYMSSGRCN